MNKNTNVSIIGAGYVGMALALCLSTKKINSYVVDNNREKIKLIEKGISPIKEDSFDNLTEQFVNKNFLKPTDDIHKAVINSDISFVCVGTPSGEDGSVSLKAVYRVVEEIAKAIKKKDGYHLIVIRSTVPPGTIAKLVEIAENASGKYWGHDFGLVSNPEFLREGSSIQDFFEGKFNIIGVMDQKEGLVLSSFYRKIGLKNIYVVSRESAELFKYVNNWWHALKIGFTNEVGRLANHYGTDSKELMNIFSKDDRLNVSKYYMRPGFAFGGSCLPKDVRALNHLAIKEGLTLPILEGILPSNDHHISDAGDIIRELHAEKIGFAGLVFKEGTDDFRESPYLELITEFGKKEAKKFVYDKNLQSKDLIGVNKSFIDGFFSATKPKVCKSIKEIVENSDVIVSGTLSKEEYVELIREAKVHNKKVFELTGRFSSHRNNFIITYV